MKQPLRVLHVNLSGGGLGRYGALFANALAARNDIRTLSVINPGLVTSKLVEHVLRDVEIVKLPVRQLVDKAKLAAALRRVIRSWKPDVVHDTAGSGYAFGSIALSLVRSGVPWVVTEHDPEPHLGMGTSFHCRLARRLIRRYADHIFVHGPLGKDVLIKQGVKPGRITVIHHGRLDPLFQRSHVEVEREPHTILFFGELRPNKGIELLIPIADRLYARYPDIKFVVAGSPKVARELQKTGWPEKLKEILVEMRKRPYFEVHDRFIPDEEVASLFCRASITLLPYLDATQSGVAMIAMPLGSVLVATKVGDLPWVIQDERTGFLTDVSVESIVTTLDFVLSHPEEVRRVRHNAKMWVERECNWDKIANRVIEVYRSLRQI